jgi:hypothetical protein
MMTDWAATTRLSARVTLAEGLVIQGDLHLQPRVAWRDGPETPLELLNRDETFFVMSLPTGEVVFVSKEQVASLLCREGALQPEPERETVARHIPLEVMMTGGAEFRGEAVSELPPARSRALDFLNGPERFFAIHNNDGTCCLNRRFVRAVRPSGT